MKTANTPPVLLTPEATARRLSISRTRAFELIGRGELRSFKIGRARLVVAESVDDWARAHDPGALDAVGG